MTKREVASLAIKLMGVFILIKSISYVPMVVGGMWGGLNSSGDPELLFMVFFYILVFAVSLAWSLFIITQSDKVAAWLIKDDHPIEIPGSVHKEDVMLVVFSCIGLYLIVTAIPTLIVYFSNFMVYKSVRSGVSYSGGFYDIYRLISPLVQIAIGIWLFAGSKGIVKVWRKIRS